MMTSSEPILLADLWQIKKDAGGQWQRQAIDFRGRKWDGALRLKTIRQKRSWTAEEVATALAIVQACSGSVEAGELRYDPGPSARLLHLN